MSLDPFFVYDFGVDLLSGVGLVYLLVSERRLMGHRQFFFETTFGIFLFVLAEPLSLWFPRWVTHGFHGLGLLLIGVGVARPVMRELHDDHWANLLVERPESVRPRPDWMTPMDDEILDLFHYADLVLSPGLIAYNIDHSREAVTRHLSTLVDHGFLTRVERGKYRLTPIGEQYFYGDVAEDVEEARLDQTPV